LLLSYLKLAANILRASAVCDTVSAARSSRRSVAAMRCASLLPGCRYNTRCRSASACGRQRLRELARSRRAETHLVRIAQHYIHAERETSVSQRARAEGARAARQGLPGAHAPSAPQQRFDVVCAQRESLVHLLERALQLVALASARQRGVSGASLRLVDAPSAGPARGCCAPRSVARALLPAAARKASSDPLRGRATALCWHYGRCLAGA